MERKESGSAERLVGETEEKLHLAEDEAAKGPRTEWHVGRVSDFAEGDRKVFQLGDREVGVFRLNGRFYAYENLCLHQGGPVCEGMIVGKVEPVLDDAQAFLGERFSEEDLHIACPWHGFEYNIETGECVTDRRLRLRSYEIVESEGEVYVLS